MRNMPPSSAPGARKDELPRHAGGIDRESKIQHNPRDHRAVPRRAGEISLQGGGQRRAGRFVSPLNHRAGAWPGHPSQGQYADARGGARTPGARRRHLGRVRRGAGYRDFTRPGRPRTTIIRPNGVSAIYGWSIGWYAGASSIDSYGGEWWSHEADHTQGPQRHHRG